MGTETQYSRKGHNRRLSQALSLKTQVMTPCKTKRTDQILSYINTLFSTILSSASAKLALSIRRPRLHYFEEVETYFLCNDRTAATIHYLLNGLRAHLQSGPNSQPPPSRLVIRDWITRRVLAERTLRLRPPGASPHSRQTGAHPRRCGPR